MRNVVVTIGALLLAGGTVLAQDAALLKRGQEVYTAQKCKNCHSVGGVGNKKGPMDDVGKKLSADEIRQWILDAPAMTAKTKATRKPVMKSYKLPQEDLDALVAYMASLKG
jgi:mono/diheme cytochrome c family protein